MYNNSYVDSRHPIIRTQDKNAPSICMLKNMPVKYAQNRLLQLICVTRCIGFQLLSVSLIGQQFWSGWCLLGSAPTYLCELCSPVSGLSGRSAIHSSVFGQLLVPRATTTTRQHRAFYIVGPSTWNGLPLEVCFLPKNNENVFCKLLKTDLLRCVWDTTEVS